MISVAEALDAVLALVDRKPIETVPLSDAAGRVLANDVIAKRDQPPFSASAMDGYAVATNAVTTGDTYTVIGEAAAGHQFDGDLEQGDAIRIFTGAPLPPSAKRVIIQEDVKRSGDTITVQSNLDAPTHIRPAGGDFKVGDRIAAPTLLRPSTIALAASMNAASLDVTHTPTVAILATGDELVQPGETPRQDQIIASNSYGLKALFETAGAKVRLLPIASDTLTSLQSALRLAAGSDLLVTIGGASVGDHDLVATAMADAGMEQSFYKVRMRPGKPLMAGKLGDMAMIGLPGNPVSSMVCGSVFVVPMIRKMLGLDPTAIQKTAPLTKALPKNGPREHYMRATLSPDGIAAFDRQDSSLLSVLDAANALIIRPPNDPEQPAGSVVSYLAI